MKIAVTVPTRGNRYALLNQLVNSCADSQIEVFVVRTHESAQVPPRAHVIDDYGTINIQRWWNRGINCAELHGADHIAVLNDDVIITIKSLLSLSQALEQTACTIATPGKRFRTYRSGLPPRRVVDGACWMLTLKHELRPNEEYRWGFGDDDLDVRARKNYRGVVTVPVEYEHLYRNEQTSQSPELLDLAEVDRKLFAAKYPSTFLTRLPRIALSRLKSTIVNSILR